MHRGRTELPVACCVYVSPHGHTRKVARTLPLPRYDLKDGMPNIGMFDLVIILCPTYGDGELPIEMEDFVEDVPGIKDFLVCELGNYYGFEDQTFGVSEIIRNRLAAKGWIEVGESLSLDSLPRIDWDAWNPWKSRLRDLVCPNGQCRTHLHDVAVGRSP